MATDGPVSRWNGVEYSGDDERLLHSALLMRSGSGAFAARSGRRPGGGVPTADGLTITVPADSGVIYDASFGGGPWLWALPAAKAVTLSERPGSGSSRIDVIVARIYNISDPVQRELKIEVVQGAAGSTPSKPTLPPMSAEVATVTVPASGALTIVANTTRTVAAGGVLPVATTAERDALPAPHAGLTVYNEQTSQIEVHDGVGRWSSAAGATPTRILGRSAAIPLPSSTTVLVNQAMQDLPGDQGNDSGITRSGGVLTLSQGGLYYVYVRFVVPRLSDATVWSVGVSVNGETTLDEDRTDQHSGGVGHIDFQGHMPLSAGDVLRIAVRQSSASDVTIPATRSRWEVRRVGAA